MIKLLEILILIKKRVQEKHSAKPFDTDREDFSVYEKLKDGYQILLKSAPESMLFEEYLKNESTDLLQDALVKLENETPLSTTKSPTQVEINLRHIFQLFLPSNTISPLMTWQMR